MFNWSPCSTRHTGCRRTATWPGKHVRVFLVSFKKWLTRYQKHTAIYNWLPVGQASPSRDLKRLQIVFHYFESILIMNYNKQIITKKTCLSLYINKRCRERERDWICPAIRFLLWKGIFSRWKVGKLPFLAYCQSMELSWKSLEIYCHDICILNSYIYIDIKWPDKSTTSYNMLDFKSYIKYL